MMKVISMKENGIKAKSMELELKLVKIIQFMMGNFKITKEMAKVCYTNPMGYDLR